MLLARIGNCHIRAPCRRQFRHAAKDQEGLRPARIFWRAVTILVNMPAGILAIEKFNQFRDDLVRRLFHQPMPPALDEHTLDIGRDHLALLDQERTAGFFP